VAGVASVRDRLAPTSLRSESPLLTATRCKYTLGNEFLGGRHRMSRRGSVSSCCTQMVYRHVTIDFMLPSGV
jgi:hypothetical protein